MPEIPTGAEHLFPGPFPTLAFVTGVDTIALIIAAAIRHDPVTAPLLFHTAVLLTYAVHRRLRSLVHLRK
ncbi:MAG: hypothetical protein BGO37_06965 [Cellulomonas sp. 73-92]|uniref:hypothetical protein n=1 Tax=Cellulomonas sp. 73-92 TaxID=1895740 RepID=UPI0009272951|nr:hypothetical protein [Cellulomonas sp. 73-92]OJV75970.1 MAG: hypothetical protein BGO37_06965 [Cellulomonas sp. 73-92]